MITKLASVLLAAVLMLPASALADENSARLTVQIRAPPAIRQNSQSRLLHARQLGGG